MATQFFHPVVGGQEQAVRNLGAALRRRGHQVSVVTLAGPSLPPEDEVDGIRVHRVTGTAQRLAAAFRDPSRRHAPPAPDPEAVLGIARVIRRERPDVVHAHDWLVHSAVVARRRSRVPVVLSLHDHSLVCANKRLMRDGAPCPGPEPAACRRCAVGQYGPAKGPAIAVALRLGRGRVVEGVERLLPVSETVRDNCGLPADDPRVVVVPNFVPAGDRLACSAALPVGVPDGPFLAFAGDAVADKGIDVLLRAHERLGRRPPLVIAGRPLALALAGARPGVHVLGAVSHAVVVAALARCEIAVVPSLCVEAFGMVALEAMAAGRPVVAARSGALADLVAHGDTGLLVPPGDDAALAAALRVLLDDPALARRFGEAGQRRALSYAEDAVVGRVEAVYAGVVGDRRPSALGPS